MKGLTYLLLGAALLGAVPQVSAVAGGDDYWSPERMAARECPSVHLKYLPSVESDACYQEMTVEASAPGTYFACNNFSCGYIGIQQLPLWYPDGRPVRVAIFSVWDAASSGDDPHAAPESERALLVQRGEGVETERFGGEGTGGKSMRLFDWKEGEAVRTLVIEKADGPDFRRLSGYLFNPETQRWELMSCWRIQALRRGLGDCCGFVEDFARNGESRFHERRATYGPVWRHTPQGWSLATEFASSKNQNPNTNVNFRFNAKLGWFSMATGGSIAEEPAFRVGMRRELPVAPKVSPPGAEVTALIEAPLMPLLQQPRFRDPRREQMLPKPPAAS